VNLQPRKETIISQAEFLRTTQGQQVKTGGVVLLSTDWADGEIIKAGTAVYVDGTGMGRKWEAATAATVTKAGLTMHDVKNVAGANSLTGMLIAGHPLEAKCTGVTANFKTAVTGRINFEL
jgi:hypothetical protein